MKKSTQQITLLIAGIIWGANTASASSLQTIPCPEILAREQIYLIDRLFNPAFQRKAQKCRQEAKLTQTRRKLDDSYKQLSTPDIAFRENHKELSIDAASNAFTNTLKNLTLQLKHQSLNASETKKTGSIPGYTTIGK